MSLSGDEISVSRSCYVLICRLLCSEIHAASVKNSDIALRFSDPDFLKESNNLAIR